MDEHKDTQELTYKDAYGGSCRVTIPWNADIDQMADAFRKILGFAGYCEKNINELLGE